MILLLSTLIIMGIALNHGIKNNQNKQKSKGLDTAMSELDKQLALMKPPTEKEINRVLEHQRNSGIITFDEWLQQTTKEFPHNK